MVVLIQSLERISSHTVGPYWLIFGGMAEIPFASGGMDEAPLVHKLVHQYQGDRLSNHKVVGHFPQP